MKKKRRKARGETTYQKQAPIVKGPVYDFATFQLRHGVWKQHTLIKRRTVFKRDEPGLATDNVVIKTQRPVKPEKIKTKYEGFQLETRVTKCDQMRERRRRAYFGYLKSPHAGKGTKSPRSDRFTVKC